MVPATAWTTWKRVTVTGVLPASSLRESWASASTTDRLMRASSPRLDGGAMVEAARGNAATRRIRAASMEEKWTRRMVK